VTEKPYRLVPESLPSPKQRRGVYEQIVEDFIEAGDEVSRVVFGDRSASTLYQGLYHALRAQPRAGVAVRRREGKVYLLRVVDG
jgi:hypothetical protein